MASNPYINKVIYGNQTLIDLTGDILSDNDVRQGKRYHSNTGEQRTGTFVEPTIYNAIPSNSSPATLEQGINYNIKNTSGLAIESYIGLNPSDLDPATITSGNWYYASGNGYAIENVPNPTALYPSNNTPRVISGGNLYQAYDNGYAISSYDNITPSDSNPVLLAPNDIVKINGNNGGYAIQSYNNITPSNSTPASFSNNNFFKANGSGYAIASYTDIIPDDADPQYIEGANMYRLQNNLSGYVYETIQPSGTSITPSNSSPVALTADNLFNPTTSGYAIRNYYEKTPSNNNPPTVAANTMVKVGGAGYMIASYNSITPSNASPVSLTSGDIVKLGGNGKAVESITDISPSNSSPASLSSGGVYKATSAGYAIENYDSVTPSSTVTNVSSGDIVKIGGSGVIVDAIPTPTSITPSNSSPVALTANNAVTPSTNGYAIESYSSKTPDDTTPPTVASGDIVKMGGSGYLYATEQSNLDPTNMEQINGKGTAVSSSGNTFTIDSGRYLVTSIRSAAATNGIQVDYIDNFVVTTIYKSNANYAASASVSGTTLTLTRNISNGTPVAYITKLS